MENITQNRNSEKQKTEVKSSGANRDINAKFALGFLVIAVAIVGVAIIILNKVVSNLTHFVTPLTPKIISSPGLKDFQVFTTAEEFKEYIKEGEQSSSYFGLNGMAIDTAGRSDIGGIVPSTPPAIGKEGQGTASQGGGGDETRVSETNVQVAGIDEPDIVKTDGEKIYLSPGQNYYFTRMPMIDVGVESVESNAILPYLKGETHIIKAFPPAELKKQSKIDKSGNLLLSENILVIFENNAIYGYNVSDARYSIEKWEIKLENNSYFQQARLYNGKLYLITSKYVQPSDPCPISPLSVGEKVITIGCRQIYHPSVNIQVDAIYTVAIVDTESGEIEKTVSFVGSASGSVIYMSETGIYLAYAYSGNMVEFLYDFFAKETSDLMPAGILSRIKKLGDYDISAQAKMTELSVILQQWQNSLDEDERLKAQNELSNRMADYYKRNKRELEKTNIVKIELGGFGIASIGSVPGRLLNQFSLDEYNGFLRIATTIGGNWWGFGFGGQSESANDVYVLDSDLKIAGSVLDLGKGERIYSARFLQDRGYLVTFKQTDPFFVLDLSDPKNPEVKGELKIPGYSSYLHPIGKDKILGFGKEGSFVKISLFDVSNAKNPKELSKYNLDEYWSDILETHHAFLLDEKHEVFFAPGGKGGYIFSYDSNKLSLKKAISGTAVRRALYINDYLYIIGDASISVLDEKTWKKSGNLEL